MRPNHERLLDLYAGAVTRRDQSSGFVRRERNRLLAEHVLPVLHRRRRPRHVKMVGEWVVDRVDLAVLEHRFVRSVRLGDAERRRGLARFVSVARRNGHDLAPFAALHRRNDLLGCDLCHTQHAPSHLRHE
jgi:hypothetical protein